MEGYSVTEAASVLGVSSERVWELLARGVLAGAPEGETGMRVFLQPRPAPAPPEPARPNGSGGDGEPRGELSPFRELLTEFRNLTERYGQALLALGEARGEVAALRSRVDLLEARMDLRLPSGGPAASPAGWTRPTPRPETPVDARRRAEPEPSAGPPVAEPAGTDVTMAESPAAGSEGEIAPEPRGARRGGSGHVAESFAEALARAEDPSVPELLGGPEAAAALAALRADVVAEAADAPEAGLPRELPPAEEVPVAEEPSIPEPVIEPRSAAEDADAATAGPGRDEAAIRSEAEEVSQLDEAEALPADEVAAPEVDGVEEHAPAEHDEVAAPATPGGDEDARPAWQDERYTAEVSEPDWWEAEALPQAPSADATGTGDATGAAEPDAAEPTEVEPAEPEFAEAAPEAAPQPTPVERAALTRLRRLTPPRSDEETVLRFGRSPAADTADTGAGDADEMEIAPTGGAAEPEPSPAPPASRPMNDALAALEALSHSTPPPRPDVDRPSAAPRTEPGRRPPTPTSAGRAYRRLRRIFPG